MIDSGFDASRHQIPEPLSGVETSEIISQIYGTAGARISPLLVESNIVLTFAGARGHTEFFIRNTIEEDWQRIDEVNKLLEEKGIRMKAHRNTFDTPRDDGQTLMVGVESLRGYERVSRLTNIPGIVPFDASTGWDGLTAWKQRVRKAVIEGQQSGVIPYPDEYRTDILSGIYKGYPDQAIFDMCDWLMKDRKPITTESRIPQTEIYGGAQPVFMFYPEHADNPKIREVSNKWNRILEEFYQSPWHTNIKNDASFIYARATINKREI